MITNKELAEVLESIGLLMELDDAQPFRVRAFLRASEEVLALPDSVGEMSRAGKDLTQLRGIGKGIAARIEEIAALGRDAYLERLENEAGTGLLRLLRVPGLGPGRVRIIRDELGITSPEGVREAAQAGRLRGLPGFGEKTEAMILQQIEPSLGGPPA